jgi:acyl dehydratase
MRSAVVGGNFFEDLEIGQSFASAGRTVSEAMIDAYAGLTGDFSDVHVDAEVMAGSEFGGRIAHGLLTLGLLQGLICLSNYSQGTAIATLGWEKVKFPKPVRAGDTLRAQWTIRDKRASASRPHHGIVFEACRLVNQHGEDVLTAEHVALFKRRGAP